MKDFQSELRRLPGWEIVVKNEVPQLRKSYRFKNFAQALAFTNQVGALAEEYNHHPEIITEWGQVTLSWWTHTAKGLTQNDFDMAGKVEALG
ncbi:MAG: 4a-hydroxytetrahydrobiopterin dehydratase [Opitutae bacterium]|nr:4a-hydroxytetrahydrobiopterin dehydratase [Opitutae bacterium]